MDSILDANVQLLVNIISQSYAQLPLHHSEERQLDSMLMSPPHDNVFTHRASGILFRLS